MRIGFGGPIYYKYNKEPPQIVLVIILNLGPCSISREPSPCAKLLQMLSLHVLSCMPESVIARLKALRHQLGASRKCSARLSCAANLHLRPHAARGGWRQPEASGLTPSLPQGASPATGSVGLCRPLQCGVWGGGVEEIHKGPKLQSTYVVTN